MERDSESAWGRDADRRDSFLISLTWRGSHHRADLHLAEGEFDLMRTIWMLHQKKSEVGRGEMARGD